ncbi:astacin [Teladorsagia circumcincta]|uniref:Astacin n=1 Tax=Teladorsagia circumcincta TaxID=45464 RepID=A0A2G9U1S7_TELCI|nr:astacin [Teladorsagia circumcincta]
MEPEDAADNEQPPQPAAQEPPRQIQQLQPGEPRINRDHEEIPLMHRKIQRILGLVSHHRSRVQVINNSLNNTPPRKVDQQYNYNKLTAAESINYTPYEYGSVMHYDAQWLANGTGLSLIPKSPRYLQTLGSQLISFLDISLLNFHYKCNGVCAAKGATCVNGGKRNPKNCATCICPTGYGGALCNLRDMLSGIPEEDTHQ